MNEVVDSAPHMPPISSKCFKMEELANDRLNTINIMLSLIQRYCFEIMFLVIRLWDHKIIYLHPYREKNKI